MKKILILLILLNLVACSSTTMIRSTDQDAKIYVDGEFKGKGSVTHTDTKIVGSTTNVTNCKLSTLYLFYSVTKRTLRSNV